MTIYSTTCSISNNSIYDTSELKDINREENSDEHSFYNPEIPKECFLANLKENLLDSTLHLLPKYSHQQLPSLNKEGLLTVVKLLSTPILIKGHHGEFEIYFTLSELFNHLMMLGNVNVNFTIDTIELVGGTVPWIINQHAESILNRFGINLPKKLLGDFAKKPRDYDFRLSVPKGSTYEIKEIRNEIIRFFVQKQTQLDPNTNEKDFYSIIFNSGFNCFTQPKDVNESLLSTVGFKDHCTGIGIDIVIKKKLKRDYLFTKDDLRLVITSLITALKHLKPEELIKRIHEDKITLDSQLKSSNSNSCQAIIDRLAGIVRAEDISSINCMGWPTLLVCYLKGDRCLTSDLEKLLLAKLPQSCEGHTNEIDMPKALEKQLINIASPLKMSILVAFWLEKALISHLDLNPKKALLLTLQACLSLKQHGYENLIEDVWQRMTKFTKNQNCEIFNLIFQLTNSGQRGFKRVISCLEVQALLMMNTNQTTGALFESHLIMHNQKPVIQLKIEGICLLLPYEPQRSFHNYIEAFEEIHSLPDLLSNLNKLYHQLKPTSPYIKNTIPEKKLYPLPIFKEPFSPLNNIEIEWNLACEIQERTQTGSLFLEESVLQLLSQTSELKEHIRILESAKNKVNTPEEVKLYTVMSLLIEKEGYGDVPIPLIWAIALASTKDPSRGLKAYQLWTTHGDKLPAKIKSPFTKILICRLACHRFDLALNLIKNLPIHDLNAQDLDSILTEFVETYQKNVLIQTNENLHALVNIAKQIITKGIKVTQKQSHFNDWLIERLINLKEFPLAVDLAESAKIFPRYIDCLQKAFPASCSELLEGYPPQLLHNHFTSLQILKSTQAFKWKDLFQKIHLSGDHELLLTAWNEFLELLVVDKQWIQSYSKEIEEVILIALIPFNNIMLQNFLERSELSSIVFTALGHGAIFRIYENLFISCKAYCTNETLEKLLQFRHLSKLEWNKIDLELAKILAVQPSIKLQSQAFKIFVHLGYDKEAFILIISILKTNPPPLEIIDSFLTFFSRISNDQSHLALEIMQMPAFGKIITKAPVKSLNTIMQWYDKLLAKGNATSPITVQMMKHGLELVDLVHDFCSLTPCVCQFIQYLENVQNLKKKPELKTILFNKQSIIVKILSIENKTNEILKLLSAINRYSLDIPIEMDSLEIYYDALDKCQCEFNDLWINFQYLAKYSKGKVIKQSNTIALTIINGLFEKQLTEKAYYMLAELLNHENSLKKGLEKINVPMENSIFIRLQCWIKKQNEVSQKELNLIRMMANILLGNQSQYEKGLNELKIEIESLGDDIDSVDQLSSLFLILFYSISSKKISEIIKSDVFYRFISKCPTAIHKHECMPKTTRTLFSISFNHFSYEDGIKCLDYMHKQYCAQFLEIGILKLIEILKSKNLSSDQIKEYQFLLSDYLETSVGFCCIFSKHFFDTLIHETFSAGLQNYESLFVPLYLLITNYLDEYLSDFDKKEKITSILQLIHFSKINSSLMVKTSLLKLFEYFSKLLRLDEKKFYQVYDSFMENFFKKTKENNNQPAILDQKILVTNLFVKTLLQSKLYNQKINTVIDNIITDKILEQIKLLSSCNQELSDIIYFFALSDNYQGSDEFSKECHSDRVSYISNISKILLAAFHKKVITHTRLFQCQCIYSLKNININTLQLSLIEQKEALKELFNDLANKSTYNGIYDIKNCCNYFLSIPPDMVEYGWKKAFENCSKISFNENSDSPIFFIIKILMDSNCFNDPNKSIEWQKASANVCEYAFEKLCQSDYGLYQKPVILNTICNEAANFLSKAAQSHLFDGQFEVYFRCVEKLLDKMNEYYFGEERLFEILFDPKVLTPENLALGWLVKEKWKAKFKEIPFFCF